MKSIREQDVAALPRIRYHTGEDQFYQRCREKINTYFDNKGIHKLAGSRMYGKTCLLFSLWILLYALILSNRVLGWPLTLLQVAWHFTMFLMSVGIAHDGTHHAYSNKPRVNRFFTGVFDYIGINSDMWEYNHLHAHHNAPNVPLYDSAIFSLPPVPLSSPGAVSCFSSLPAPLYYRHLCLQHPVQIIYTRLLFFFEETYRVYEPAAMAPAAVPVPALD